jgi:hypothetical protein
MPQADSPAMVRPWREKMWTPFVYLKSLSLSMLLSPQSSHPEYIPAHMPVHETLSQKTRHRKGLVEWLKV